MILVEMNSVAEQWVRNETPPGITFKSKNVGSITFIPTFVSSCHLRSDIPSNMQLFLLVGCEAEQLLDSSYKLIFSAPVLKLKEIFELCTHCVVVFHKILTANGECFPKQY
jgi:hypothetical protein